MVRLLPLCCPCPYVLTVVRVCVGGACLPVGGGRCVRACVREFHARIVLLCVCFSFCVFSEQLSATKSSLCWTITECLFNLVEMMC